MNTLLQKIRESGKLPLKALEVYVHIINYRFTGVIHLLEPPILAVFRHRECKFSRSDAGLSSSIIAHPRDQNTRDHKIFVVDDAYIAVQGYIVAFVFLSGLDV